MNLRLLIIPAILIVSGLLALGLGAWIVEPEVFWAGVAVVVLGFVLASPESDDQP